MDERGTIEMVAGDNPGVLPVSWFGREKGKEDREIRRSEKRTW